jgi:hypothetical protein
MWFSKPNGVNILPSMYSCDNEKLKIPLSAALYPPTIWRQIGGLIFTFLAFLEPYGVWNTVFKNLRVKETETLQSTNVYAYSALA